MGKWRTLFLSDFHLGSPACNASKILDFLSTNSADTIYLVGDIVDGWHLTRPWPTDHNAVIQRLYELAKSGTRLIYIPGNHDAFLRGYNNRRLFDTIDVVSFKVHEAADGKRYLVIHGDIFDKTLWLSVLWRAWFPIPHWLKNIFHRSAAMVSRIERATVKEAIRFGADGVIAGHTHLPQDCDIMGVLYLNCGDWCESNTAIGEDLYGDMSLIQG